MFFKNTRFMFSSKINLAFTLFFVFCCCLFLPQCTQPAAEKTAAKVEKQMNQAHPKMLVHHVFFYMAPEATEADKAALRAGIETLTKIEALSQWHLGVAAPTDRPVIERGYTFSWLTIFENGEAEAAYQQHPTHLEFIKNCSHLWSKVVVYDSI